MELCVEATDAHQLPEDTFLSLRIGDGSERGDKQARFTASRTYRFPAKGENRTYRFPDAKGFQDAFGRVEVYKRIGVATTLFNPAQDTDVLSFKDIQVPMMENGYPNTLQMRVSVKGAVSSPPEDKGKRLNERVDLAQHYLREHNIPEMIAEAMRLVMHNKPGKPYVALSEFFRARDTSEYNTSLKEAAGEPPEVPNQALKPSLPADEAEPVPKPLPPPVAAAPDEGPPPVPARDVQDDAEEEEEEEECKIHKSLPQMPTTAADKASVAKLDPEIAGQAGIPPATAVVKTQMQLPSVGTWLQARPFEIRLDEPTIELTAKDPGAIVPTAVVKTQMQLPSVGTWLQARPFEIRLDEPTAEDPGMIGPSMLGTSPAALLPSVGTWLAASPFGGGANETGPHAFHHTPSVGSWLQQRLEEPKPQMDASMETLQREMLSVLTQDLRMSLREEAIQQTVEERDELMLRLRRAEQAQDAGAARLRRRLELNMIQLEALRQQQEASL